MYELPEAAVTHEHPAKGNTRPPQTTASTNYIFTPAKRPHSLHYLSQGMLIRADKLERAPPPFIFWPILLKNIRGYISNF